MEVAGWQELGSPGLVYSSISDRAADRDKRLRGRAVVYRQDVQVSRMLAVKRRGDGRRGAITELSDKSRRRLALVARNVEGLTHLITLTYPGEWLEVCRDGRELKRHMGAFRKWLVRRGIGGLWFVEFQRRGAPHVHLLVNGGVGFAAAADAWYRIVASGDERHHRAGTRVEALRLSDGAARYAAKYASKFEQKLVPEYFSGLGRMWGLFGGVKPHRYEIEGALSGEVARVHRVVRRLQVARSRGRDLRFADAGVHGWTSYGVGAAVEQYVRWRRGERVPGRLFGVGVAHLAHPVTSSEFGDVATCAV